MYSIKRTLVIFLVFFIAACRPVEKQEESTAADEVVETNLVSQDKINAQNVFNTLPTRELVMKLIEQNKLEYNSEYLSNPVNVNKFTLELFRAVNLGIYGADLCVASSFEQTQESMIFLKSVNILANSLGVSSAFNQSMFDRIEKNKGNNDSVISIVTNAFKEVDQILKYNKRAATAAIILSGCWIEGFYVSCKMANEVNEKHLIKTIIEQKESLKNLIVLLENAGLEKDSVFITEKLSGLLESIKANEAKSKFDKEAISLTYQKIKELREQVVSVNN